jgi:hypothetical protein
MASYKEACHKKQWFGALMYAAEALCSIGNPEEAAELLGSLGLLDDSRLDPANWLSTNDTLLCGQCPNTTASLAVVLEVNRSVALTVKGDLIEAKRLLRGVLDRHPTFGPAWQGLMYIYLREGNHHEALTLLKSIQSLPSESA